MSTVHLGTRLRDLAAAEGSPDAAPPLTQAEVDALPPTIPRVEVTLSDGAHHEPFWTWVHNGIRYYRAVRWRIPALHTERYARGRGTVCLIPPPE